MDHHQPLHLYLHIPFCCRKCRYCDFYSVNYSDDAIDDYCSALVLEWESVQRALDLTNAEFKTLYIGGGTPSLIPERAWAILNDGIFRKLRHSSDSEWTIECNPDSFTEQKALRWLESGVNRLSIGTQTLSSRELLTLGRIHDRNRTLDLLSNPVLTKFSSVGADLMYGIPGQSMQSLESSLDALLEHTLISHLSAYELTIHENTRFGRHRRLLPLPSDDQVADMFMLIHQRCVSEGWEHYEVSNYARPGHRSRHNLAYWHHRPYIGLGASAHSFFLGKRWANGSSVERYIDAVRNGMPPVEFEEVLDEQQLAREKLFLGLRTSEGICRKDFIAPSGEEFFTEERHRLLATYVREGFLTYEMDCWRPTPKGLLFADGIATALS